MPRSFNGTSDVIRADAATLWTSTTAFSYATWVKGAAVNNHFIYSEGKSGDSSNNWFGIGSGGTGATSKVQINGRSAGGSLNPSNIATAATVFDSTWHHLVYSQDASGNYAFYVDGAADNSGSFTPAARTMNQAAMGALCRNTNSLFFACSLAHTATWIRAISAGEAKTLAAGVLPSHFAPDHYWPIWGADSPEPDLGNSTHVAGTLTGTSSTTSNPPAALSLLRLTV